jgi:ribosomal protein S18 acetylase RimI-like enzyme
VRERSGTGRLPDDTRRRVRDATTADRPVAEAAVPIPGSRLSAPEERRVPAASPIVVRGAVTADLPAIVALRIALLREHAHNTIYGRLRADAESRAERLFAAQLKSPTEIILLAEIGGETVGVLRCIQSTGSPLLEPAQYAYVSSVYVLPRAREQGVLRALLAAADRWCAERGLDEMRLHNAADNPLANAAWEALGFEVVEHLRIRRLPSR